MKRFLLYYHTIKHLKLKQILFQLKYRLIKPKIKSCSRGKVLRRNLQLSFPVRGKASWNSEYNASFLNQTKLVNTEKKWDVNASALWLYNLHYFDDLNVAESAKTVPFYSRLIDNWILTVSHDSHSVALDPYPSSLRLVNWCKYIWRHNIKNENWNRSIYEQSNLLARKLEYHLLANHLFANGKALIFVGVFLEEKLGRKLLGLGLNIIKQQVAEQFLPDGGHFERSPMYHNILLWDLLDLIFLAKKSQGLITESHINIWQETAVKALNWMDAMEHPDGGIAFFNDSTLSVAPTGEEIKSFAKLLGLEANWGKNAPDNVFYLKNSGFISVVKPLYKLIADIGDVSPRYQPGHSHAETLSFELSVRGKRVFVNSGISQYGNDAKRQLQRATKSHNTLIPNNSNSSQVWGGFRVAKASKVEQVSVNSEESVIDCTIRGFWDLNRKGNSHNRRFSMHEDGFSIYDKISEDGLSCVVIFKLHPDIKVLKNSEDSVLLSVDEHAEISMSTEGGKIKIIDSTWYPSFGHEVPTKTVLINVDAQNLETNIRINNARNQ
ncbi:alginate lyase family protein [Kangiella shandongensis]|uniref:alginate lyase family protein n=1 Tax=Kangiella shandongensis TaxID=2763258 RepID=UPI001CBF86E0|nr:alginate lyase family protein [Kangiella shandongensis]